MKPNNRLFRAPGTVTSIIYRLIGKQIRVWNHDTDQLEKKRLFRVRSYPYIAFFNANRTNFLHLPILAMNF